MEANMEHFVLEAGNPAGRRGGDAGDPPRKLYAGASRTVPVRTRAIAAVALFGLASVAAPARAADVDLTAGVLSYSTIGTSVANALTISLAGGTYTIDDPADPAITLSGNALGQGCAPFDSNTVTCPPRCSFSRRLAATTRCPRPAC
jgi:hypothetical protein